MTFPHGGTLMVDAGEPMMQLIGNGHVAAFAALAVVGLGVGHSMGGPVVEERPVLALSRPSIMVRR